jgi:hypothetical protein
MHPFITPSKPGIKKYTKLPKTHVSVVETSECFERALVFEKNAREVNMSNLASTQTNANTKYLFTFFLSLAAVFFLQFALTQARVSVYDEGLIVVGATRVLHGEILHRDFYTNYGPLQFSLLSLAFKAFGSNLIVHRALDASIKTACIGLVFLVCRRISGLAVSLLSASLSMIWLATLGGHGYPVWLSVALILLVVWLLDHDGAWYLFTAGIISGMVFATRYDLGIATIFVVATTLLFRARAGCHSEGGLVRAAATLSGPYLLGSTLLILVLSTFYFVNNVLPDFYFQVIEFGATKYPLYRRLPFPNLHSGLIDLGVYLPILVLVLCFLVLASWREWVGGVSRTLFLSIGLCIVLYFKGIVRVSSLHMSASIIFSFVVLAPLIGRVSENWTKATATLRVLSAVTFVVVASLTIIGLVSSVRSSVAWSIAKAAILNHSPADSRRVSGLFLVDEDEFEAADYIRTHNKNRFPVFVGAGRHDKIFVNDVFFYFLAERDPATKWYDFNPGLQTTAPIQAQIIADLIANKSEYIILTGKFDNVEEPNLSSVSSGVNMLDNYFERKCASIWSHGTYSVLSCS